MRTFLLFFVCLCALAKEYRDPIYEFSFRYDNDTWEVVPPRYHEKFELDKKFAEITLVTIQKKAADEKYRSRFSVVVDAPGKLHGSSDEKLRQYTREAVDFLKNQRFSVFSTKEIRLSGLGVPAYEIRANQRDFGLMFRQIVLLRSEKAYLLTLATRTDQFEKTSSETSQFFDTFKFYGKLTR